MKLNRFSHLLNMKKEIRYCECEGCDKTGEFRAPKNKDYLKELSPANIYNYHFFCEEHVREYNLKWDYYKDMDEEEIFEHRYNDVFWQRPTWSSGSKNKEKRNRIFNSSPESLDRYKVFYNLDFSEKEEDPNAVSFPIHSEESKALNILGVFQPTTYSFVKSAYKEKAKKYHPDINGGDTKFEERLKTINSAYQILKKAF